MSSGSQTGPFAPADRLLDARDFSRVLQRGRRRSSPDLVVVVHARQEAPRDPSGKVSEPTHDCRLGITTSRKVGHAVIRNRFKRRTRDWFRRRRSELAPGTDIVVIARRSGARLDFRALDARLSELLALSPMASGCDEARGRGPSTTGEPESEIG